MALKICRGQGEGGGGATRSSVCLSPASCLPWLPSRRPCLRNVPIWHMLSGLHQKLPEARRCQTIRGLRVLGAPEVSSTWLIPPSSANIGTMYFSSIFHCWTSSTSMSLWSRRRGDSTASLAIFS
jgi:hypothetical protein